MKKLDSDVTLREKIKLPVSKIYSDKPRNPVNKKIIIKRSKHSTMKNKDNMTKNNKNNKIKGDSISIITIVNSDEPIDVVFSNYEKQSYLKKEMLIAINSSACDVEKWLFYSRKYSMVRVYYLDNLTQDECIKYCIERSIYKRLLFF